MIIKFTKLTPLAQTPVKAHTTDAGFDLVCARVQWTPPLLECGTGLAVEIPAGYVGLLFPRSSVSHKDLRLANSVGVIDAGYRGEIILKFKVDERPAPAVYQVGERIGQLVILQLPEIELQETTELGTSERGQGGFGSSGQ